MDIAYRPSGGRGEYELPGEVDGVVAADVYGREVLLAIPGVVIATGLTVKHDSGKPRFRGLAGAPLLIGRQVAVILLMPKPVRTTDSFAAGVPVLRNDAYTIKNV